MDFCISIKAGLSPFSLPHCSTSVRTTGYPCPPKPHTPHLHINLLFNIILCHSRPICHSPSKLLPSQNSIHILFSSWPLPVFFPLPFPRCTLSLWGVKFFPNSAFKCQIANMSSLSSFCCNPFILSEQALTCALYVVVLLSLSESKIHHYELEGGIKKDIGRRKGRLRTRVLTGKNAQ